MTAAHLHRRYTDGTFGSEYAEEVFAGGREGRIIARSSFPRYVRGTYTETQLADLSIVLILVEDVLLSEQE